MPALHYLNTKLEKDCMAIYRERAAMGNPLAALFHAHQRNCIHKTRPTCHSDHGNQNPHKYTVFKQRIQIIQNPYGQGYGWDRWIGTQK